MVNYTVDVLLIGLITVLFIGVVKAPIKTHLIKKGLNDDAKMKKIFKAIVTTLSFVSCFIGALVYFNFVKHVNPFDDATIIWYTLGTVGASQFVYSVLETYGRDGLLIIIKMIIANRNNLTDLSKLQAPDKDLLAQKLYAGIHELFENAPISEDDIKKILDKI